MLHSNFLCNVVHFGEFESGLAAVSSFNFLKSRVQPTHPIPSELVT